MVEEEQDEFYMPQGMKPSTFQSTNINIFKVERSNASKQVNLMINEEAKQNRKAAKRVRQKSTENGTPAVVEGDWRLECTHKGCSARGGGSTIQDTSPCTSRRPDSPRASQGICTWQACR